MSDELKMIVYDHNRVGHIQCGFCGKWHDLEIVSVALVNTPFERNPNGTPKETIADDICSDCLAAFPERAAERILNRVAKEREYLGWLEELAKYVRQIQPENWKTVDEVRAEEERIARLCYGDEAVEENKKFNFNAGLMAEPCGELPF